MSHSEREDNCHDEMLSCTESSDQAELHHTKNPWLLAASIMACKALMATARRSLFVYVPFEAQAAGASEETIMRVLAAMNLSSGISPLAAPTLLQGISHPSLICVTVALTSAAELAMAQSDSLLVFAVAALGIGIARGLFDPVVGSFYSTALPKEERARVSSVVECAWGLSSFLGMPAYGFLLALNSSSPHYALTVAIALTAIPFIRMQVEQARRVSTTAAESAVATGVDSSPPAAVQGIGCDRFLRLRKRSDARSRRTYLW